jgi:hypothetical protein
LTGDLAIDAQLRVHRRSLEQRGLNDIGFLVEDFASIPGSLAASFLQHRSRSVILNDETGDLKVLSVEDLVPRTTALVSRRLRRGQSVNVKHVKAFTRLFGLRRPEQLAVAWNDHRQQVPLTEAHSHAN